MCSPIGDGAAAIVVALGGRSSGSERIRCACWPACCRPGPARPGERGAVRAAARRPTTSPGVGPGDVDVVEVHDAAAPGELIVCEELGLRRRQGLELLRSGATSLGGRMPVNPSGGLLAKGHPIGATGCAQLTELTDQLRGRCGARQVDGARVALAENGGGFLGTDPAAMVITVLSNS